MDEDKLEEAMAETVEQSFNDSELEDIMSEIENLEKEFVEDGEVAPESLALKEAPTSNLQDEIDKEVESIADEMTPQAEEIVQETIAEEAPLVEETPVVEEVVAEVTPVEEVVAEIAPAEEVVAEQEIDNVVSLPAKETVTQAATGSNMDFSASGTMDLNLNFKIGDSTATLKVDGDKGLVVEMAGVEIKITETEGCTVTMEGGVNFNIPLTTTADSTKKNAA